MRGCAPGEEGPFPTSLDRCQVAGFHTRRPVAHTENTAMNADQGAVSESCFDLGPCNAVPRELPASHDTVCPRGAAGKNLLDCPVPCSYSEH